MRKLEFRFWDKVSEEMWYQDDLEMVLVDKDKFVPMFNCEGEFKAVKEVLTMEYIGRLDINGVKVFKGDIVRVVDSYNPELEPFIGYVDYRDCSFVIRGECVTNYRWMDYDVEVIGNIFQDKQLLSD